MSRISNIVFNIGLIIAALILLIINWFGYGDFDLYSLGFILLIVGGIVSLVKEKFKTIENEYQDEGN
ncbi:hypothetical protein Q7A53_03830 [Halobacillus rhizosphaerae]|uniref:hypothetical protein n=1 Tax=Halobacillus rhizosphaerae TaxID=3064889 RepID=UPI00398BA620